jgi:hypothetical protein
VTRHKRAVVPFISFGIGFKDHRMSPLRCNCATAPLPMPHCLVGMPRRFTIGRALRFIPFGLPTNRNYRPVVRSKSREVSLLRAAWGGKCTASRTIEMDKVANRFSGAESKEPAFNWD